METKGRVPPQRMTVYKRVHQCPLAPVPPSSDQPISVPLPLHLWRHGLIKLPQGDELRVTPAAGAGEIHGLVQEGGGQERAINVPPTAAHVAASLRLVVGDPKDVRMRGLGVFVEGALHLPQLGGQINLMHRPVAQRTPTHTGWG